MKRQSSQLNPFSGLLDSSILLREARRWKNQKRWVLLLGAFLLCGAPAAVILGSLLTSSGAGQPEPANVFAIFMALVALCSSALAFYQSMQVLRRELATHTLEDLFLTLQKDRGVVLSVVASGVMVGGAFLLLFLPVILLFLIALSASGLQAVLSLAMIVASIFVSAAVGSYWFFVSQGLFTVQFGRLQQIALAVVAPFTLLIAYAWVAAPMVGGGPARYDFPTARVFQNPVALVEATLWVWVEFVLIMVLVWSVRAVWNEAARMEAETDGARWRWLARLLRMETPALLAIAFAFLVIVLDHGQEAGISPSMPFGSILFLFPPAAVGDLLSREFGSSPASLQTCILLFNAALLLAVVVFASGLTAASIGLYRRLRQSPESAAAPVSRKLKVADVGQQDWRGFGNPVLTREIRTRLRSGDARIFIIIAAFVSAAAAIIPVMSDIGYSATMAPSRLADLARASFLALALTQLGIVWLFGPGIGSEVISLEREQKTFDMLIASRLSPKEILRGRIVGVWAMLLLLLSPSLPLLAVDSLFHAVPAVVVLSVIGWICLFAGLVAQVSVCISAIARTSVIGKWTAYCVCLFLGAWLPPVFLSQSGEMLAAVVSGAVILLLILLFLVLPLWIVAVDRLKQHGSGIVRSRSGRRRRFVGVRRRFGSVAARLALWALAVLVVLLASLKIAFHNVRVWTPQDLGSGIQCFLTVTFSDQAVPRQFRREVANAYQDLARERQLCQQEGILLTAAQMQAPLPPESQNAAPDYARLFNWFQAHPWGTYDPATGVVSQAKREPSRDDRPGTASAAAPFPMTLPPTEKRSGVSNGASGPVDLGELLDSIGSSGVSSADEDLARRILAARPDIMALVHQAARKPSCVFQRNWAAGDAVRLPEYATMREFARLLHAEGYLLAKQGRYHEAIQDGIEGLNLAQQAGNADPILISYLVGVACESIALNELSQVLYLAGPNPQVAAEVRDALQQHRPHFDLGRSFSGDLSGTMITLAPSLKHGDPTAALALFEDAEETGQSSGPTTLQTTVRWVPGLSQLTRRLLAASAARLLMRQRQYIRHVSLPYPERLSVCRQDEASLAYGPLSGDPLDYLSDMLAPGIGGVMKRDAETQAREAVDAAGAAVLAYRGRTGAWPDRLAQAISPIPMDPFTGQSLQYRRVGDRFIVYSRGGDQFDGGKLLSPSVGSGGATQVSLHPASSYDAYFIYPSQKAWENG